MYLFKKSNSKKDKQLDSKAESTIIAANMPELDLKIGKNFLVKSVFLNSVNQPFFWSTQKSNTFYI